MRWSASDPREWHRHYCLTPVVIGGEAHWLEHVERRLKYATEVEDLYEYRPLAKAADAASGET